MSAWVMVGRKPGLRRAVALSGVQGRTPVPKIEFTFAKGKPRFKPLGNVDSACPYCSTILDRRPKRKKKCPHCGNFIYVRTRPLDRLQVLLTEEQTHQLGSEWAIYHETFETHNVEEADYRAAEAKLKESWPIDPSPRDVLWSLYNQRLLSYGKDQYWGLYRNTLLDMGELERKQGFAHEALNHYFLISYIDANGPNNLGPHGVGLLPPFQPDQGFQAPGIIKIMRSLIAELGLTEEAARREFRSVVRKAMPLLLSEEEVWGDVAKKLFGTSPESVNA